MGTIRCRDPGRTARGMSDQARMMIAAVLMAVLLLVSWSLLGLRGDRGSGAEENEGTVEAGDSSSLEVAGDSGPYGEGGECIPVDTISSETVATGERIGVTILNSDGEPMVRGSINPEGGCIESWEIVGYEDLSLGGETDDGHVDLLASGCFLARDSGGTAVSFSASGGVSELVVRSDSVDLTLVSDSGYWRVYRFYADSYEFRVGGNTSEWSGLAPGLLPVTEEGVNPERYFGAVWLADKTKKEDTRKIEEDRSVGRVVWVGARSKYFAVLIATSDGERADGFVLSAGGTASPGAMIRRSDVRVYAGPVDYYRLRQFGHDADQLVDFGWPVIRWIGMVIFWFSAKLLSFIGNWGLRIIVVSLVLKVLLLPLTQRSFKSIRKMQLLQPKLTELQKKFRKDPVKQREAMARLYRDEKVNPMGGCLPLLLQMPVFFALYRVLSGSVALRGAPFVLWIDDLSRPEVLIPFGGSVLGLPGIGLLPVMMGLAMFFQQKLSATDPKQKSMMYIMPIFMTWLFMRFPAGLTLYWFVNNILTIAQQEYIRHSELRASPGADSTSGIS